MAVGPRRSIRFASEDQIRDLDILAAVRGTTLNAMAKEWADALIAAHEDEIAEMREEYRKKRAALDEARAALAALGQ